MSDPMTARQAWEIAKLGDPEHWDPENLPSGDWSLSRASDNYARACAIVEALVAEHEADVLARHHGSAARLGVYELAFETTRALELGEKEGGA